VEIPVPFVRRPSCKRDDSVLLSEMKVVFIYVNAKKGASMKHRSKLFAMVSIPALLAATLAIPSGPAIAASKSHSTSSAPKVVKIAWPEEATTLDPDRTTEALPYDVLALLGGTLTNLSANGKNVVPGLASSWSASSNGLTWTFTLRPGLKFSNGQALTAADVKATFDRQRTDKADPNIADFANWKDTVAESPTELVIDLSKPEPSLPLILAAPYHVIFPAASVASEAFYKDPISDGPFKLQSMSAGGTQVTLVANPDYYGLQPAIPKVQFLYVPNDNTRVIELRANQIQAAGELAPSDLKQLKSDGLVARDAKEYGSYMIWISDKKSPLSSVNVRKAISDAIDRAQINDIIWNGTNPPIGSLFPTTMPEYLSDIPISYNVAAAKKLLAGTPCANGCTIPMLSDSSDPVQGDIATIVAQDVAPIGITIQIDSVDSSVQANDEADYNFQMAVGAVALEVPDPISWLDIAVLYTGGIESLFSGWNNPSVTALVGKASSSSGATEAADIARINGIFAQDLPYIPLVDYTTSLGLTKQVAPYVTLGSDNAFAIASK
jgi:peptide/nickel transport system substrate-binding protein